MTTDTNKLIKRISYLIEQYEDDEVEFPRDTLADCADALEALAGEVENLRHDVARHMGIANAAEAERDELANWKASFLHENEQILASNAQLAAERARLKAALARLVKSVGDECFLDHNGNCQTHFIDSPCAMAIARKALEDAS